MEIITTEEGRDRVLRQMGAPARPSNLKRCYKRVRSNYHTFVKDLREHNSVKKTNSDGTGDDSDDRKMTYKLSIEEEQELEKLHCMWKNVPKKLLKDTKADQKHFDDMKKVHEALASALKEKSPTWDEYIKNHEHLAIIFHLHNMLKAMRNTSLPKLVPCSSNCGCTEKRISPLPLSFLFVLLLLIIGLWWLYK